MQQMTSIGGLSRARLKRMRDTMARHVESGALPGLVTLISRHGEIHIDAIGSLSVGGAPMQRDSIFRIASMTKPIGAVAAMILVEECKLRLDDPVDAFLPELADRKVLRSIESEIDDTVPAKRAITLRDVLSFRLGYGMIPIFPDRYPIQKAVSAAGLAPGPVFPSVPSNELMRRYGALPLVHQPGERWLYNVGSEMLGVLIARVAKMSLGDFLAERIFEPLGMKDTGFYVPQSKQARLTTTYVFDRTADRLNVFDDPVTGKFASPPVFENAGAGLVSTAEDFQRIRADAAQRRPAGQ
jgi:CubicO group peptidase (beta-lactamase class C family)